MILIDFFWWLVFFILCHSKGHWGYYWKRSTCVLVPFCFIFSYFILSGSREDGFFFLCAGGIIPAMAMWGSFTYDVSMLEAVTV